MSDIFALASQQASWLQAKRLAIASNIANANTPGFRALDVQPFSAAVERSQVRLARSASLHLDSGSTPAPAIEPSPAVRGDAEVYHSGNNVNIDQEFISAGEVARSHALNVAIVRSFHRMLLASAKA